MTKLERTALMIEFSNWINDNTRTFDTHEQCVEAERQFDRIMELFATFVDESEVLRLMTIPD